MFPVKNISDKLLFSTLRIETESEDGTGSGTGFFYGIQIPGKKNRSIPVVLTNKHVVHGASNGYFHICLADESGKHPSGKHIRIEVENFQKVWFDHPDANTDLCAMSMTYVIEAIRKNNEEPFYALLEGSLVKTDEELSRLQAVEDVLMVGYPIGLWDEKHNLPIVRKGITATHPCIDFNGAPMGVIDMACWPGSSGSPVLIANEGTFFVEGQVVMGQRSILLGVLFGGPTCTQEGEIVSAPIPMQRDETVLTQTTINLGYIVKAKEILKLEELILEQYRSQVETK